MIAYNQVFEKGFKFYNRLLNLLVILFGIGGLCIAFSANIVLSIGILLCLLSMLVVQRIVVQLLYKLYQEVEDKNK